MTVFHVLNFVIPVACMGLFGFLVDHMCKPEVPSQETGE